MIFISAKMAFPKHQLSKFERAVFVITGVAKRGKVPKEARLAGVYCTQPLICRLRYEQTPSSNAPSWRIEIG